MPLYEVKLSWTDRFHAPSKEQAVVDANNAVEDRLKDGEDLDTDFVREVGGPPSA